MRTALLRLARLLAVALLVSFFSYLLLDLVPGDPTSAIVGLSANAEDRAAARAELGLDRPLIARYLSWLGDALTGDLGTSSVTRTPASELIGSRLPNTVQLALMAEILALIVAIPAAALAARRAGGSLDRVTSVLAFGTLALPTFVLGVYLKSVFAVRLGWLPSLATDLPAFGNSPIDNLEQMALPTIALASALVAGYVVLLRSDMVTTLQEDHVMLARARGLSERRILWRHVFRSSSLNLITAMGLSFGALIGGTVVVEVMFAVPGLGRLLIESIFLEDYAVVQALVLVFTVSYVVINAAIDLLYTVADPRIRRRSR